MKISMTFFCCLCLCISVFGRHTDDTQKTKNPEEQNRILQEAVNKLQKLKVSGYIQTQFQWGEEDASLKVGTPNENTENPFNRVGIRRGRIKFAYEEGITSGVFQLDLTEKGVGIKDAYLNIRDPFWGTNGLKAGVFDRPFGNEISYSSSRRESPERSTVFHTLFPEERDLGAMLQLQTPETSALHFLKLEAGLFAGNGIKQETDNRKDFIGHLSANKKIGSRLSVGGGVSYYYGSVYQGTENIYTMEGPFFVLNNDPDNTGKFAKREYIGFDLQFGIVTLLGTTRLRAEYLLGTQPGGASGTKSPNTSSRPASDVYIRDFNGGYALLVHEIGTLPLSAVFKYDWYDPNVKITGNDIGLNNTASGDIALNTIGFGLLYDITKSLRLQTYYEINKNEITENLADYSTDRKDNVFTLRLQYKF